jgi:hypothetical protein
MRLRGWEESQQQSQRQPHSGDERNEHRLDDYEHQHELRDSPCQESNDALPVRVSDDSSHHNGAGQDGRLGSIIKLDDDLIQANDNSHQDRVCDDSDPDRNRDRTHLVDHRDPNRNRDCAGNDVDDDDNHGIDESRPGSGGRGSCRLERRGLRIERPTRLGVGAHRRRGGRHRNLGRCRDPPAETTQFRAARRRLNGIGE